MSSIAEWLNVTLSSFDYAILSLLHGFASPNGWFTAFMKTVSILGEKGLFTFALSFIFMFFKRTRKAGICMFGAICCGALVTNIVLKDLVARPRPFLQNETYYAWWEFVGSVAEDGFSFPSGHATAAFAASTALFLCGNKKVSWLWFVYGIVMCVSRCYLVAHYPSDVLVGALVGAVSAVIAYLITVLIYFLLRKGKNGFCRFVLNFDIVESFERLEK